jgi:hypothetical protein
MRVSDREAKWDGRVDVAIMTGVDRDAAVALELSRLGVVL